MSEPPLRPPRPAASRPGGKSNRPNVYVALMRAELLKEPCMAPQLEQFAVKVFKDGRAMCPTIEPGARAERIYELYSGTGSGAAPDPNVTAELHFCTAVQWSVRRWMPLVGNKCYFQYTGVTVVSVLENADLIKKNRYKDLAKRLFTDFIYFTVEEKTEVRWRLYLNVRQASAPMVVGAIAQWCAEHKDAGIAEFKIAGPRALLTRDDKIVVYTRDESAALRLADHLTQRFRGRKEVFLPGAPQMTREVSRGMSVAAEPTPQATGFRSKLDKHLDEEEEARRSKHPTRRLQQLGRQFNQYARRQSAGTVRSELIAMAIENYLFNRQNGPVFPGDTRFKTFKRYVCAAFRGHGLDPLNPER